MQSTAGVVALVVAAMALAGCSGGGTQYPHSYLLDADELPPGLRLSDVPPDFPMENPGRVPDFAQAALVDEFGDVSPDDVWAELVEPMSGDGGLLIAAGFWADLAAAQAAVDAIRAEADGDLCQSRGDVGQIYRDGQVIVVIGGDEDMRPWVDDVVATIRVDAPGLADAC